VELGTYDVVSEHWRRRLLGMTRGALFHSPSYFLPDHDGPKVATMNT